MGHARLIVQKFGGTSVADAARIRLCAQRALDAARAGHKVVVVVSAMGRTTDALLRTAMEIDPNPPPR
ncbi:MAG: aspartate kinase, partial [Phycisphaerales bacterium JB064]